MFFPPCHITTSSALCHAAPPVMARRPAPHSCPIPCPVPRKAPCHLSVTLGVSTLPGHDHYWDTEEPDEGCHWSPRGRLSLASGESQGWPGCSSRRRPVSLHLPPPGEAQASWRAAGAQQAGWSSDLPGEWGWATPGLPPPHTLCTLKVGDEPPGAGVPRREPGRGGRTLSVAGTETGLRAPFPSQPQQVNTMFGKEHLYFLFSCTRQSPQ